MILNTNTQLIILHQNTQKISNKQNRLQHLVEQIKPNMLIFTERGLKEDHLKNVTMIYLKSYFSRKEHRKSGIAIYVEKSLAKFTK